ncbi:hypothetical protein HK405_014752, partial [Cladochytrium tenue]
GSILMVNGAGYGQAGGNAGQCQFAAAPVFEADLYFPSNNTWRAGVGRAVTPRLYHSGALLLDDATVVTLGSEMGNYLDCWGDETSVTGPGGDLVAFNASCWPNHLNDSGNSNGYACRDPYTYVLERYTPPYKSRTGPNITSAPTSVTYNSTLAVRLDPATGLVPSALILLRYSSTTHSTNTDQRYLRPDLLFANQSLAVVRAPPSGAIAPPGNYHLFAVAEDGTPSLAAMVKIAAGPVDSALPPGVTPTYTPTASKSTTAGAVTAIGNPAAHLAIAAVAVAVALVAAMLIL